ncbi:MAG: iron-siderophore ABC transporter substrate-binding protein [Cyanobacteria bacterium P01_B01_bin.77]
MTLFTISMVAIAACQSPTEQSTNHRSSDISTNCRFIDHRMGKTEVCGQPQRIVVLGPYLLEPLLALGIQPVGYADHEAFHQGDFTEPSQQIPYLGSRITQPLVNVGSADNPSLEAMLKIQPDLILSADDENRAQYQTFSTIAPTLILQYDQVEENLKTLAQAVNRPERSEQLLTKVEQQVIAARQALAPVVDASPNVLLLHSQFPDLYLGNDRLDNCSDILKALGFQFLYPPGFENTAPRIPISLEILPQFNAADLIVMVGRDHGGIKQLSSTNHFEESQLSKIKQDWEGNAIAQSLTASQAGKVYFIPYYLCMTLPGPIGTELYLEELKEQLLGRS